MKNKKDYIYEYSDLNLFQTRVKLLTGPYKNTVLEFGSSGIGSYLDQHNLVFDYTVYELPENLKNLNINSDKNFQYYLSKVLGNIIEDRLTDPNAKTLLDEAASVKGFTNPTIKINEEFYMKKFLGVTK